MRHLFICLLSPALLLVSACSTALPRDSVVHLEVQSWSLDHRYPWRIDEVETSYGSGVYLGRGLILTNAHVVQNPQQITISAADLRITMAGKLVHISEEADLALVEVDTQLADRWFSPIRFDGDLKVGDEIQTLGFPGATTTQALTSGVVSRISTSTYLHSGRELQVIQVDAAINGGASGGALLKNGKLAGILFQMSADEQNVGHVIPMRVIRQFLADMADGRIDGAPELGVAYEYVLNPMKRARHGLDDDRHALEVFEVSAFAQNAGLQVGDLILGMDGMMVGAGGWLQGEKNLSLRLAVAEKQIGNSITLTLMRDGKTFSHILKLQKRWSDHYLVPIPHNDVWPAWISVAGVVLVEMNDGYFASVDEASRFLNSLASEYVTDAECPQSAVIIANVLPHSANQDYAFWLQERIVEVNGARIQNFQHLNYLVKSATDPWIEMTTAPSGGRLVFERAALAAIDSEINAAWQLPENPFPAPPDSLSGICH
jgi:S1-C subfamily serine protease